jgi:hypothetical protein
VEEAGVVSLVGQLEEVAQLWIYAGPLGQRAQLAVAFKAAILTDAQEDDAVYRSLHGKIDFTLAESGVSDRYVCSEIVPPFFDVRQEGRVYLSGSPLGF